jgi:hypothetical protein
MRDIDLGYGISTWGHRYETWANDMGDDSIDNVIGRIDMGYSVTLTMTLRDKNGLSLG